jgi:hypothetical protein
MIVVVAWLIAVLGVLVILWIVSGLVYLWAHEALLLRSLKAPRRVMDWKNVRAHLEAGEGTFIIQQTNKVGVRFWWTPDDLIASAPQPIREFDDLGMGYITGRSTHPFVVWCASNYLSAKTGKAFLTRYEGRKLPPGPVQSNFFREDLPRARIVQTLLVIKG